MLEDLKTFMSKITILNKDLSEYYDKEKGVKFLVPNSYIWTRLDYFEYTNQELKKAIFEEQVDSGIEFNYIDSTRRQSKYEITKREEDRWTITESKVKVNQVWVVSNGMKYKQTFNNKEDALKLLDEINNPLKEYFK